MSTADADALARGDIFEADDPKDEPKDSPKDELKNETKDPEVKDPPKDEVKDPGDESKDEKKKSDARIPLSRHKELLNKERDRREALERQLAQYQKGSEVQKLGADLTKLEDGVLDMEAKYNKLLADGETEKARELMTKIRQAEREIIETKSEARLQEATARAAESARYSIALERIEEAYPQLNEDSDEFDEEKMNDVADLKAVYQQRGMTPTQALQKAVKKLMGSPETKAQEAATTVAPRVSEKDIAAERKKQAAAKTADAVKSQPPATTKSGEDNNRAVSLTAGDVMKMSQAEFAKLDEAQLKKLRGDEA